MKDYISFKEAKIILNVKTKSAMWKIEKSFNFSKRKIGTKVYYNKDEIYQARSEREKTKTPNPNSNRKVIIEQRRENAFKNIPEKIPTHTLVDYDDFKIQKDQTEIKITETLHKLGIYEECDSLALKRYIDNEAMIECVISKIGNNLTIYDADGCEIISPLMRVYDSLMRTKANLERTLAIGAGNRKGLSINEQRDIEEMEGIIEQ